MRPPIELRLRFVAPSLAHCMWHRLSFACSHFVCINKLRWFTHSIMQTTPKRSRYIEKSHTQQTHMDLRVTSSQRVKLGEESIAHLTNVNMKEFVFRWKQNKTKSKRRQSIVSGERYRASAHSKCRFARLFSLTLLNNHNRQSDSERACIEFIDEDRTARVSMKVRE